MDGNNNYAQPDINPAQPTAPAMEYFSQADVEENRNIVFLAALFQIFFGPLVMFVPLIVCKNSPYARFYANQGVALFLMLVFGGVAAIIPILGWIVFAAAYICYFIFLIMNALNASKGLKKAAPLVGGFSLIK